MWRSYIIERAEGGTCLTDIAEMRWDHWNMTRGRLNVHLQMGPPCRNVIVIPTQMHHTTPHNVIHKGKRVNIVHYKYPVQATRTDRTRRRCTQMLGTRLSTLT